MIEFLVVEVSQKRAREWASHLTLSSGSPGKTALSPNRRRSALSLWDPQKAKKHTLSSPLTSAAALSPHLSSPAQLITSFSPLSFYSSAFPFPFFSSSSLNFSSA